MDGGCRIIMDRRIAILGIIVEDMDRVERVNELLHEYREYIVGRMGMPYRERGVSVISVVMDADTNTVSALSGKLGMIPGVRAKAVYSKT
jgi:putative iron-only hydrogenase system regulator